MAVTVGVYRGSYFDWLCSLVNLKPGTFDILLHELMSVPFEWKRKMDIDRAEEVYVLRGEYLTTDGTTEYQDLMQLPPSVLEVLICLAKSIDEILETDVVGDRTRIWFWELIDNLGLSAYPDASFVEVYGEDMYRLNEVRDICKTWLERRFDYNGNGSPFPLSNAYEDQRSIDIMDQLNAYVMENHMFGDELL